MSNISGFQVTGPVYLWVALGSGSTFSAPNYLFLGFTESGLTFNINPYNEIINVDYGGPSLPGDVSQFGFDANISGTFTRYDETVAIQISGMSGNFSGQQLPGSLGNNQMGALMYGENVGYPILTYFPYSTKSEFASLNALPGFNFLFGYLDNPTSFVASVRRKAPEFNFKCQPVYGTFNGSTFEPNTQPWNASRVWTNVMPGSLPPID